MGWYGDTVGSYQLSVHDSLFDRVKKGKPKEYYEKQKVECYFRDNSKKDDKEEIFKYPLLTFCKLKKLKKYYDVVPTCWNSNIFTKLLFDIIKAKKILLTGQIYLWSLHYRVPDGYLPPTYYLESTVGNDEMFLSNQNKEISHHIKDMESYLWIIRHGLCFKQDNGY